MIQNDLNGWSLVSAAVPHYQSSDTIIIASWRGIRRHLLHVLCHAVGQLLVERGQRLHLETIRHWKVETLEASLFCTERCWNQVHWWGDRYRRYRVTLVLACPAGRDAWHWIPLSDDEKLAWSKTDKWHMVLVSKFRGLKARDDQKSISIPRIFPQTDPGTS